MALIAQHPIRSREIRTVLKQSTWGMVTTTLVSLIAIATDIDEMPSRSIMSAAVLITTFSVIRLCEVIWLVHGIAAIITASQNKEI